MEQKLFVNEEYRKAKKRVKAIKGSYIHCVVYCLFVPIIILFNLEFTPQFKWFWFSVIGLGINLTFHYFSVFSDKKISFGKNWEERKIKEYLKN